MTLLTPKQDYNLSTQAIPKKVSAGYQFFLLFNHLDPGGRGIQIYRSNYQILN